MTAPSPSSPGANGPGARCRCRDRSCTRADSEWVVKACRAPPARCRRQYRRHAGRKGFVRWNSWGGLEGCVDRWLRRFSGLRCRLRIRGVTGRWLGLGADCGSGVGVVIVLSGGGFDVPWYGLVWLACCAASAAAVAANKAYTKMFRFIPISFSRAKFPSRFRPLLEKKVLSRAHACQG